MGIHQIIRILRSPFSRGETSKPLQIGPPTDFRKEEFVFPFQYEKDTGKPMGTSSSCYSSKSAGLGDVECLSPRRLMSVSR
ncbi:hypothetical protein FQN54_009906 [Arachnomyces sp. PD_36]|nr:hypothetical protein FQN54_009906 [Arachnomyces sp. PD_36]